jgi:aminoglycoside phosphotransferase (APT) family kinase protein
VTPLRENDALRLIDELHAHMGIRLTFTGMPELGAIGGAAFVRWPDGRDAVLSRCAEPETKLRRTAEILAHVRACGIPAPRYDLIAELPECTVLIQERLPGDPTPAHIDPPMMRAILEMADGFAGLLADFRDVPLLDLTLDESRTTSLERYDDRSRRLLAWIERVRARGVRMAGTDLIHRDYHRDNILFRGQEITGIVDWHDAKNLCRGDRRYHLVNLAFDFAWALGREWNTIDPAAMRLLDDALDDVEPELLDAYWAHNALGLVDGLIRAEWYPDAGYVLDYALTRVPSPE